MTQFNSAMSYILKNSIVGVYPDYVVDYATALLSKGALLPASGALVDSVAPASIAFSWLDNTNNLDALAADITMVVVYNPAKEQASYLIEGTRADGNVTLLVPESFTGDEVHCYLAFKAAAGSKVSNSVYVGAVTVA